MHGYGHGLNNHWCICFLFCLHTFIAGFYSALNHSLGLAHLTANASLFFFFFFFFFFTLCWECFIFKCRLAGIMPAKSPFTRNHTCVKVLKCHKIKSGNIHDSFFFFFDKRNIHDFRKAKPCPLCRNSKGSQKKLFLFIDFFLEGGGL